jgi:hypothetical protein
MYGFKSRLGVIVALAVETAKLMRSTRLSVPAIFVKGGTYTSC